MENYQILVRSLQTLAGVCDGAKSEDGMGFNGRDTRFGKSLAEQTLTGRELSAKQQSAAIKMLQTYRNQLAGYGIQLPTITQYAGVNLRNGAHLAAPAAPARVTTVTITEAQGQYAVRFPYDPRLVERIKALPRRKFDPQSKTWMVPADCEQELIEALEGTHAKWDEYAEALSHRVAGLRAASARADDGMDVPNLTGALMPFQRAGVAFLEQAEGRALIGDEMGLGKTIQAISYLALHPELRPAVIVVPASLKSNWKREIEKWLDLPEHVHVINGTKSYDVPGSTIFIINYDLMSHWLKWLEMLNPAVLICDEFHYCKNPKSKRTKAVQKLAQVSGRVIGMSGTPLMNRPKELFPLLQIIQPDRWRNWMAYAKRYCNARQINIGKKKVWDFNGASNLPELHDKLKSIMVRRLKHIVMADLPPKRRVFVPLNIDMKKYNSFLAVTKAELELAGNQAAQMVIIEKAKQYVVEQKMDDVFEWVDNFLDTGEKLILFTAHKATVAALLERYDDQIGTVYITGDTPNHQRGYMVDAFQNNPDIKLFIGNIQAAGVGLTLTAASNVAFVELGWRPGDMTQAEDRAHRIGQTNAVTAWYLLAEGTIEEDIYKLLEKKRTIVEQVTDGTVSEMGFANDKDLTQELVELLLGEKRDAEKANR